MKDNSCPSLDDNPTGMKIAEQSNVSARTVKNAEKFAEAVDKVEEKEETILIGVVTALLSCTAK